MLIKGIRSFSPDNQNVIEFYRPLTLIVGHNGAGKTVRARARAARAGAGPPSAFLSAAGRAGPPCTCPSHAHLTFSPLLLPLPLSTRPSSSA